MILLSSLDDTLEILTTASASTDYYVSWVEWKTGQPGASSGNIASGTTTTILSGRNIASERIIKTIIIRNKDDSVSQTVTVKFDIDGTERFISPTITLLAGEALEYNEATGWTVKSAGGLIKTSTSAITPFIPINTVILAEDVVNSADNAIADVTGLSFDVVADASYWFRFSIPYTAAATTTGSRWAVNGPAAPTALSYNSRYTLTATSETVNYATAYDIPAAANATSLTVGNVAIIEGHITPSDDGTVIARFASEVNTSAITAKAGAVLQWTETLEA